MVVVTNEPFVEIQPMLGAASSEEIDVTSIRRLSYVEAYKNITSSMQACPLKITSLKTALELLLTGVRLQNMPLVKQCIEILDRNLDEKNVLAVYSHLSSCKTPTLPDDIDFKPSAPPIVENEDQIGTDWVLEYTDNLRHNCLLEIDKHADYVLSQKEILDLSYLDILAVVQRNTLQVSDELIVYSAIYRWGISECHRRKMDTNLLNLRAVLRYLCYCPRYGLMSKKTFMCRTVDRVRGPARSEILEEKEWRLIKFYIEEKSKKREAEDLPHKASLPRTIGHEKPKVLSSRSSSCNAIAHAYSRGTNFTSRTSCETCIINFLTCWTAVFD